MIYGCTYPTDLIKLVMWWYFCISFLSYRKDEGVLRTMNTEKVMIKGFKGAQSWFFNTFLNLILEILLSQERSYFFSWRMVNFMAEKNAGNWAYIVRYATAVYKNCFVRSNNLTIFNQNFECTSLAVIILWMKQKTSFWKIGAWTFKEL